MSLKRKVTLTTGVDCDVGRAIAANEDTVFKPFAPWLRDHLELFVHPRLESHYGDGIGETLEHLASQGVEVRCTALSR